MLYCVSIFRPVAVRNNKRDLNVALSDVGRAINLNDSEFLSGVKNTCQPSCLRSVHERAPLLQACLGRRVSRAAASPGQRGDAALREAHTLFLFPVRGVSVRAGILRDPGPGPRRPPDPGPL